MIVGFLIGGVEISLDIPLGENFGKGVPKVLIAMKSILTY